MARFVFALAAILVLAACDGGPDSASAPPAGETAREPSGSPNAPILPDDSGNESAPSADTADSAPPDRASPGIGPCLVQGEERIEVAPLRAVGTEPFWGARIEGRCVTYSHPDDQVGTRVWTRFTAAPGGGRWAGALDGSRFELVIRPEPGCSDGMSDKVYPLAAELLVAGERRAGCAEPLRAP